jgi:hypothetical protein
MSETKLNTIVKKIDNIEQMIWEDRKFFINMLHKVDKILQFINDFTVMDDIPLDEIMSKDEQKVMKELTDKLSDIKQFEKEMDKYRKYLNPDQVGES